MKIHPLVPVLAILSLLSACENSTSSSSPSLPGSPDPALAGTWRTVGAPSNYTADTQTIVLTASGSFTSVSHNIEKSGGVVQWESKCNYSGTWSAQAGKLYSYVGGTCTDFEGGTSSPFTEPASLDTADYTLQGNTLKLIHIGEDWSDTMVFTKM